jgi:hypothetical protein
MSVEPLTECDLFEYAAARVANKTVMQRIGHSAKLHSARSAFSSPGSFGSKAADLAGMVGRGAMSLVPIPGLGSLVKMLEEPAQEKIKKHYRKRNLDKAKADKDAAGVVKFELKELSVEEMDRYRWKVEQSIKDLNAAIQNYPGNLAKKIKEGAECDAHVELAMAAEQATRRIQKLRNKCLAVKEVMDKTLDWLKELESGTVFQGEARHGVDGKKNEIMRQIKSRIDQWMKFPKETAEAINVEHHGKCQSWCWLNGIATPDKYEERKNHAAEAAKFLADFFTVEGIAEIGFDVTKDKTSKAA